MKNINWSMIVFSVTQVETWIEYYEYELKRNNKVLNSTDRVAFNRLKDATEKFIGTIHTDKEALFEYASAISVVNKMLSSSTKEQATVILESLKFLAKHGQALTSNSSEEMAERLQLISDISDYAMNFSILELRKLQNQVIRTPIKVNK